MKPWTREEDQLLKLYMEQRLETEDIAKKLGRSYKSVAHRRSKLLNTEEIVYAPAEKGEDALKQEDFLALLKEVVIKDYDAKRFPTYDLSHKAKSTEILNLVISDLHTGKINVWYDTESTQKVVTYNDVIRHKFEKHYLDSVIKLLSLWNHGYYFEKLNIFLLGDLIDNDRIFEGQKSMISMPAGRQVFTCCAELVDMIGLLSGFFPEVEVTCLIGNHGRTANSSKEEEPVENNFEFGMYKIMELMFQKSDKKNIKFTIPDSRFYSVTNYGHKIFMSHGETIRGASVSYATRKAKELLLNLPNGYNLYVIGHRHESDRCALSPTAELLVNGCWVPYDDYAFKLYGVATQPAQWCFGSSPKRVISSICVPIDFRGV
jgi:hypothetical protein